MVRVWGLGGLMACMAAVWLISVGLRRLRLSRSSSVDGVAALLLPGVSSRQLGLFEVGLGATVGLALIEYRVIASLVVLGIFSAFGAVRLTARVAWLPCGCAARDAGRPSLADVARPCVFSFALAIVIATSTQAPTRPVVVAAGAFLTTYALTSRRVARSKPAHHEHPREQVGVSRRTLLAGGATAGLLAFADASAPVGASIGGSSDLLHGDGAGPGSTKWRRVDDSGREWLLEENENGSVSPGSVDVAQMRAVAASALDNAELGGAFIVPLGSDSALYAVNHGPGLRDHTWLLMEAGIGGDVVPSTVLHAVATTMEGLSASYRVDVSDALGNIFFSTTVQASGSCTECDAAGAGATGAAAATCAVAPAAGCSPNPLWIFTCPIGVTACATASAGAYLVGSRCECPDDPPPPPSCCICCWSNGICTNHPCDHGCGNLSHQHLDPKDTSHC